MEMRRVALRRVGAYTGKKAALPPSMPELLDLAKSKLELASPATRIFSADGDEYDAGDIGLIGPGFGWSRVCARAYRTGRATLGA